MVSATESANETGAIEVRALGANLLFTSLSGRTTRAVAETAWEQYRELIATMHAPVWVSDSRRLVGFAPCTLSLGARWFSAFRERGGTDCLVVSKWPVAIMAARTMALGFGVHIHALDTIEAAMARALVIAGTRR